MKAVVCAQPGRLELITRPTPKPKAGEALVRVRRVGVCGTDMHIYKGKQPFLSYPRIMGHELSGEVSEAPAGSAFAAGDQVCIMPYMYCGVCIACRKGKPNCCMAIQVLGVHCDGGMAEYVSVPDQYLLRCDDISLDEAAMVEFLAIGAHAVARADVQPGQRVLVVGVGPIGLGACLFAKLRGAEVTALDPRADRLAYCRSVLGLTHTLLLSSDNSAELAAITDGEYFDVVFDATGAPAAMEKGFRYVGHGGAYALISVVASDITFSDPEFHKRETTLLACRNATLADFSFVMEAMRRGDVPTLAFCTHRATLADFPATLDNWINPATGVIKALIEC